MPIKALIDWLRELDHNLFSAVNGIRGEYLDTAMLLGTRLGDYWNASWIIFMMLCLIAIRRFAGRSAATDWIPEHYMLARILSVFVVSCVLAAVLVALMKIGIDRQRPLAAMTLGTVHVLTERELNHSFPSGQAAFAMLIASVFWPYCRYWGRALLVLFAMWVGLSRISVGAHFPTDVIAGYLCGGISGWLGTQALILYAGGRFFTNISLSGSETHG